MDTRLLVAVLLWVGTAALVAATLAGQGDPCHPSDWSFWTLVGVGFCAAGAMSASVRARVAAALAIGVFVGLVIDVAFWFLLLMRWVGSCTA
jgi:hypothetical protein